MKKLEDVLREKLKNPEFKREWDALEPEFRLIREQLEAENKARLASRRVKNVEEEDSGRYSVAL